MAGYLIVPLCLSLCKVRCRPLTAPQHLCCAVLYCTVPTYRLFIHENAPPVRPCTGLDKAVLQHHTRINREGREPRVRHRQIGGAGDASTGASFESPLVCLQQYRTFIQHTIRRCDLLTFTVPRSTPTHVSSSYASGTRRRCILPFSCSSLTLILPPATLWPLSTAPPSNTCVNPGFITPDDNAGFQKHEKKRGSATNARNEVRYREHARPKAAAPLPFPTVIL